MKLKTTKLTYRILFQNLFFAVIPLTLFCILLYVFVVQTFIMIRQKDAWDELKVVQTNTKRIFSEVERNLYLAASNPIIRSKATSFEEKIREIHRLKDLMPEDMDFALWSQTGDFLGCSEKHTMDVHKTIHPEISSAKELKILFFHERDLPQKSSMDLVTPVSSEAGDILCFLSVTVSSVFLQNWLELHQLGSDAELFLLSERGDILAAPEIYLKSGNRFPDDVLKKITGSKSGQIIFRFNNQKNLCAYKKHKMSEADFSYITVVLYPYDKAFFMLRYLRIFIFSSLVLLVLIVVFGGFYQSRKLTYSLVTFMEKIGKISQGNLSVKTNIATHDEIGYLSRSFDAMIEKLGAMRKDLEEKNEMLSYINQELIERLASSEKTSLIGKISSGISHNLKNTVFLIRNSISECMKETDEKKRGEILKATETTIQSIIDTIDPLLYFAKEAEDTKEMADLKTVLSDISKIIVPYFQDHLIEYHVDYQEAPAVRISIGQIQQAVLNVLINAKEAYQGKDGPVFLKLYEEKADNRAWAVIEIADKGVGISQEQMEKVFQPFQTTKGFQNKREGTGIGLFISQLIVRNNDGEISLESQEGKGTRVIIKLPGEYQ
ncbi:MAG: hypothetical protein JW928_01050 [Candidatus Aureabacteria bacterium]|nr:hypothetical protein [Candidatus Auribacterota bacterium]